MRSFLPAVALALLLGAACALRPAAATPRRISPAALDTLPVRGTIGDTVRVVVNHVRHDRREQFERFMREVLRPTMDRAAPGDPETADHIRRARFLKPVRMDADSTYAYLFIVDPAANSTPYNFVRLIQRSYPPEQAGEYVRMYRESLARPSESYTLVNAVW